MNQSLYELLLWIICGLACTVLFLFAVLLAVIIIDTVRGWLRD